MKLWDHHILILTLFVNILACALAFALLRLYVTRGGSLTGAVWMFRVASFGFAIGICFFLFFGAYTVFEWFGITLQGTHYTGTLFFIALVLNFIIAVFVQMFGSAFLMEASKR